MLQPSSGREVARWCWQAGVTVHGFLALQTTQGPWHGCEPFRMDVFITLLALPKVAFVDTNQGHLGVSQLVEFAVEITDRECAFRCLLDFFKLIGASLNADTVAMTDKSLQLNNPSVENSLKPSEFSFRHRGLLLRQLD
jgi:hypothetical protein